jgi:hypothetical protein
MEQLVYFGGEYAGKVALQEIRGAGQISALQGLGQGRG